MDLFIGDDWVETDCVVLQIYGSQKRPAHIRISSLTRHCLGYYRTHNRLGGGEESDPTPPPSPAISRTDGRIEPREEAFESCP